MADWKRLCNIVITFQNKTVYNLAELLLNHSKGQCFKVLDQNYCHYTIHLWKKYGSTWTFEKNLKFKHPRIKFSLIWSFICCYNSFSLTYLVPFLCDVFFNDSFIVQIIFLIAKEINHFSSNVISQYSLHYWEFQSRPKINKTNT